MLHIDNKSFENYLIYLIGAVGRIPKSNLFKSENKIKSKLSKKKLSVSNIYSELVLNCPRAAIRRVKV